jgi:hypothetical protein
MGDFVFGYLNDVESKLRDYLLLSPGVQAEPYAVIEDSRY